MESGLTSHTQVLSRFGRALCDDTRAGVLLELRDGAAYPTDLAQRLGVSRTSLSNHLSCLRGCGLVVAVPEGKRLRYELADHRVREALDALLGAVVTADPEQCEVARDGADCC